MVVGRLGAWGWGGQGSELRVTVSSTGAALGGGAPTSGLFSHDSYSRRWSAFLFRWLYGSVRGIEPRDAEMMLANQANWDQRTPIHLASSFYGVDGSRAPDS